MKLIEENSLRVTEDGFEVKARLMWYRSLPLSCVESISLAVDGEMIDSEAIRLGVNDELYALDKLNELVDRTWNVGYTGTISAEWEGHAGL